MARRKQGRHSRGGRRFTPRRWLPFVALVALVAAAVVISDQVAPPDTEEVSVSAPESLLPVAAVAEPFSSTWFCGGGTAVDAGEGADLSVVVSNAADEGARAVVTYFGAEGEPESETVEVPVNGRVRVRARDVLAGEWAAATVEVFGGRATVERRIDGEDGFDQAPCASAASSTWYVPSGSTLRGANETLFLFNPYADATAVDIAFATDDGRIAPQDLTGVAIPPRSLRVVTIENPSRRREVAAMITTRTGRIVVDRLQTYDGSGDPVAGDGETPLPTGPPRGIASTPGIATASDRWFFPDARMAFASRTQLAILNPSGQTAELDLTVGFAELDPTVGFAEPDRYEAIDPIRLTVRAGEQTVFDFSDDLRFQPGMEMTLDVASIDGVPVVAELVWHTGERDDQEEAARAVQEGVDDHDHDEGEGEGEEVEHFHEGEGENIGEGEDLAIYAPGFSVTAGSPVGSRSWFLAGQGADAAITAEIVVANPSDRPIDVTVAELVGGAQQELAGAAVTLPACSRVTLDLSGAEPGSPLIISGSGPIVVGRTLWATTGRGASIDLAMPFPDQVVSLPAR